MQRHAAEQVADLSTRTGKADCGADVHVERRGALILRPSLAALAGLLAGACANQRSLPTWCWRQAAHPPTPRHRASPNSRRLARQQPDNAGDQPGASLLNLPLPAAARTPNHLQRKRLGGATVGGWNAAVVAPVGRGTATALFKAGHVQSRMRQHRGLGKFGQVHVEVPSSPSVPGKGSVAIEDLLSACSTERMA